MSPNGGPPPSESSTPSLEEEKTGRGMEAGLGLWSGVRARGYVRWIILALLEERPRCGYEIRRAFAEACEGWRPSPGGLYPILHDLRRRGFIAARPVNREGRHLIVYELRPEGRALLQAAATQHWRFVSAMRRILGKHGTLSLFRGPSLDVDHLLTVMHERVGRLLEEIDLVPEAAAGNPETEKRVLRSRLKHLRNHIRMVKGAITRLQARLTQLEQNPKRKAAKRTGR